MSDPTHPEIAEPMAVASGSGVKAFFEGWHLYTTVIDNNYMMHEEVIRILTRRLQELSARELQVLETGCGDAHVLSRVARSIRIRRYLGIELSEQAMSFARRNLDGLVEQAEFLQGDMTKLVRSLRGSFDVIIAGHTLHHLRLDAKHRLFADFKRVLSSSGTLIVYDEVCAQGESREEFVARAVGYFDTHWKAFSRQDLRKIRQHVSKYDFPESLETWRSLGVENGFNLASMTFLDSARIFGIIEFKSDQQKAPTTQPTHDRKTPKVKTLIEE